MIIHKELPPVTEPGTYAAVDIEMYGQEDRKMHHRYHGTFASLQICTGEDVYFIPDKMRIADALNRIGNSSWVFHNSSYDIRHLEYLAPNSPISDKLKPFYDTMLIEKELYGGYYDQFALSDLVRRYFDMHLDKSIRADFSLADKMSDEMIQYACEDAYYTWKIFDIQKRNLPKIWEQIDMLAVRAFLDFQPVYVNVDGFLELAKKAEERGRELEEELGINVSSPKQVKECLYKQGIKVRDTAEDTLKRFVDNKTVALILEARQYRKAASTYGKNWIEKNIMDGDYVIPHYNVIGAETGRTSSRDPNTQQLPIRKMPEYRDMFITHKGEMAVADISMQEPCILAFMSQDKHLLEAIRSGEDVHLYVTRALFNDQSITGEDERRKVGKGINLGLSYGLTARGLSEKTNISEDAAQKLIDTYFQRFPDVYMYVRRQRDFAGRNECVETTAGRRIWINKYHHSADNNAINAGIQGGAADLSKLWIVNFWKRCMDAGMSFPVTMMIHDELVLDYNPVLRDLYTIMLEQSLTDAGREIYPDIPFRFDIAYGDKWSCKS